MLEMTLIFWMNTDATQQIALFSYAVKNSPCELFVGIQKEKMIFTVKSSDTL